MPIAPKKGSELPEIDTIADADSVFGLNESAATPALKNVRHTFTKMAVWILSKFPLPSEAEAEARTDTAARFWSAQRVGQSIAAAIAELSIPESAMENVSDDATPELGGPLSANGHQVRLSKGADVMSATSLAIGDDGNYFDVTGTTTVAAIAAKGVGTVVRLHFDGILTLTHHATDFVLPTGANITTAAGDEATFVEYAAGDWRCVQYQRASGAALVAAGSSGIANVSEDTTPELGGPLSANGHQIREAKGVDVGSATSLPLGDDGNYFSVTGTTTITSIAAKAVGTRVTLRFAGILTLTHHATDLILPTAANITTAAGDVAVFREYATGDWVCESYQRANGQALASSSSTSPGGPTAVSAITADVDLDSAISARGLIVADGSSGTVVVTIRPNASYSYATNYDFWIVASDTTNAVTLARGSGVTLYDGTSDANLTLVSGVVYHVYRESSNVWRIISKS